MKSTATVRRSESDRRQASSVVEICGSGTGRKRTDTRHLRSKRVIPGFGITLGVTIAMLSILILIPLGSILIRAFTLSPGEYLAVIGRSNVLFAFANSMLCSLGAAVINVVFGLILAWILVRYDFPGKKILDGLIELPFCLPTAVAGITLSKMYSDQGEIGGFFARFGIHISYTHAGLVLALVFVGIPFVVRAIQPVLEKLDSRYEEAARMLGAGRTRTFFKVILPELIPSVLTGFALAFARGIGEYGSVIYISGNSERDHTQVISYVIMQKLERLDYQGATAIALVLLILSFVLLFVINMIQGRQSRRTGIE